MQKNYLNNKDILAEIHKSKSSYCYFTHPEYADYDVIISSIDQITPEFIADACHARKVRLAKIVLAQSIESGEKRKMDEIMSTIADQHPTDIVIRLMTWDHVPIDIEKTAKALASMEAAATDFSALIDEDSSDVDAVVETPSVTKYIKVNFKPFQHFKLGEDMIPYCVGKSQWKGDLEHGEWCTDHGQITDTLARMFLKLAEKYASKSNWNGYSWKNCYIGSGLVQLCAVALRFDESRSDNPFSYFTTIMKNCFTWVLNCEKKQRNIRDDLMEMNNINPSWTRQNSGDSDD